MKLKNKKTDLGISEIVGEILLLSIAIVVICGLSFTILSSPPPIKSPIVEISGAISENQIILTHQGGESLPFNTKILLSYKNENIIVGEYLEDFNSNSLWDIGEKVYYPLYEDFNETSNPDINIMLADVNSNSVVFVGKVYFIPECDMRLYISVNNSYPIEYDIITFNISAVNECNINVSGIQVEFRLPEGFTYDNSTTTQGLYNVSSGIWDVGTIGPKNFANLSVSAIIGHVIRSSAPTQLALILDGSGSISSSSWSLMKQGISSAMDNNSYFPDDGTCELTVVQFGGSSPPKASLVISPTVINSSNINSVKNTIDNMAQMGGYTPMSCGVYLACDKVKESSFFDPSKRQIFLLVTDGIPNCERIPGTYNGNYRGNDWSCLSNQKHSGTYSAGTSYSFFSSHWGDLICDDLDTKNATSIMVDFWYRLSNTESDDLELYFYNGTSYNLIASLGGGTKNTWLHYTNTITNPQYFIS
ncbi:MAG: VWA domain-containing protein, partial [bacterium]